MAETQRYDATFKKVPGTLTLTATHIAWVPSTPGAMDRQHQALNRVTSEWIRVDSGVGIVVRSASCAHPSFPC